MFSIYLVRVPNRSASFPAAACKEEIIGVLVLRFPTWAIELPHVIKRGNKNVHSFRNLVPDLLRCVFMIARSSSIKIVLYFTIKAP
jgi:hypothetical protein